MTVNKVKVNGVEADLPKGSGSGGGSLSAVLTSNTACGGIGAGKTYDEGTSFEDILKDMLVKYIAPGISVSLTPNTALTYIGNSIPSVTIKATVTKNSYPIKSVKFYVGSTLLDTVTTGVENGGTFSFTYNTAITSTTSFHVVVNDGSKDTDSGNKTITFVNKSYFGTVGAGVTNPTASDITGLADFLQTSKGVTKNGITVGYGKVLYAYPKSLGALTSIKDANNVQYISSYTRSEVTIDGVAYYCYLLTDAAGLSNFTQIFA